MAWGQVPDWIGKHCKRRRKRMNDFFANLERVLRYFLPGIIFLIFVYYFHSNAINALYADDNLKSLLNLFGITLVIFTFGTIIYIIQRYTIAVTLDYLFFAFGISAFAPSKEDGYRWWQRISPILYQNKVSEYVKERFEFEEKNKKVTEHLLIRHAHCHILIVILVFWFIGFFYKPYIDSRPLIMYKWSLLLFFILAAFTLFQLIILEKIEKKVIGEWKTKK